MRHYVDPKHVYNLPNCTDDGRYAVPGNTKRFYTCTRNGRKYDQFIFECEPREQYDPALKQCTKSPAKQVHKVSL